MSEQGRIARYFAPLANGETGSFHLTDDAAILDIPAGQQLVITTDSVIESIHVLAGASAQQFAQKLVRRNLSDLAAMGAKPWRYSVNLHTPHGLDDAWFAQFAATLAQEQTQFAMQLIGGDSTSGNGPIHTSLTCLGLIENGTALRRNGAHADDDLYVSGTIGDAAIALLLLQQNADAPAALVQRYHCPEPRLSLGRSLHGIATAAMDISDGLVRDVGALCATSHVGCALHLPLLPLSPFVQALVRQNNAPAWELILNGGDDYELIFTAPPSQRQRIDQLSTQLALPLTRVGEITAEKTVHVINGSGDIIPITHAGWEHH